LVPLESAERFVDSLLNAEDALRVLAVEAGGRFEVRPPAFSLELKPCRPSGRSATTPMNIAEQIWSESSSRPADTTGAEDLAAPDGRRTDASAARRSRALSVL
jgi:hypothetical protein